jgi:hypothetical protein
MKMNRYYTSITTFVTPYKSAVKQRRWAGNTKRGTVENWMRANGVTEAERSVHGICKAQSVEIEREMITLA